MKIFQSDSENLNNELKGLDEDIIWSNQAKQQLQGRIRKTIRDTGKTKYRYWNLAPRLMTVGMLLIGMYFLITLVQSHEGNPLNGSDDKTETPSEKVDYTVSNQELSEAAKQIGVVKDERTLNFKMMEMSFQKVSFNNHNFNVPGTKVAKRLQMTKGNIAYLRNSLYSIEVDENKSYEIILNRWMEGNFNNIDKDFKELRKLIGKVDEDSAIMKPTIKSESDEKEYILHFFGQNGLNLHNKQW